MSSVWQDVYRILVWQVLQPLPLLYLALALGIFALWRKRTLDVRRLLWVTIPFVALTLLSLPLMSWLALGSLEWLYPPLAGRPSDVQAIVVLASYVAAPNDVRLRPEMDADTMYRCLEAAALYRNGHPCPVVISGGHTDAGSSPPSFAAVMRDHLVALGVNPADIQVEGNSTTTYENATESYKILRERQIHKILLVTTAIHLHRSVGCFRKLGLEVVPCGCHYRASRQVSWWEELVPNPDACRDIQQVCHEWAGTLWYRWKGRI